MHINQKEETKNDTNRKIKKGLLAEEQFKRAQANLAKAKREEKAKLRKEQDRHKFMMGGCVVKYFPEAYDFSEQEMNRIIACAFSLKDVQNMIRKVVSERTPEEPENVIREEADDEGEEA